MFFNHCNTLDELKAEYRRLAMRHHPDHGGDTETMQRINAEYTAKFETLKHTHNATHDENHQTNEVPADFIRIIEVLLRMGDVDVELCGCWLWISGNTKPHKEELKSAGCRWSANKARWYWRPAYGTSFRHRGTQTIDGIRARYGSQRFTANGREERTEASAERLTA